MLLAVPLFYINGLEFYQVFHKGIQGVLFRV